MRNVEAGNFLFSYFLQFVLFFQRCEGHLLIASPPPFPHEVSFVLQVVLRGGDFQFWFFEGVGECLVIDLYLMAGVCV